MKYYSEKDQWVEVADGVATIGISRYAADQMGELTYVDGPESGRVLEAGESFGIVESVKAASEVFAPIGGTVCEVNQEVVDHPEIINEDAEGKGWLIRLNHLASSSLASLMEESEYLKSVLKK